MKNKFQDDKLLSLFFFIKKHLKSKTKSPSLGNEGEGSGVISEKAGDLSSLFIVNNSKIFRRFIK